MSQKRKAVFFDRDGVINKVTIQNGIPSSPREYRNFELVEGIADVLKQLKARNYVLIIVTNQPDIARGLLPMAECMKMHTFIRKTLSVDDIVLCPHDDEDECSCRKPKSGMLVSTAARWSIDLTQSFIIGDTWRDAAAGRAAGCSVIIVDKPYNKNVDSDYRIYNIRSALDIIVGG